jgi:hypothetical protein
MKADKGTLKSLERAILACPQEQKPIQPDIWQGMQLEEEMQREWRKSPECRDRKKKLREFLKNYKPEPYAPDGWQGPWPPIPPTPEEAEAERIRTVSEQDQHMRDWGFDR